MHYKYSLNPKVRGYIEWQLEHYHDDKKQLELQKIVAMPNVTQHMSETAGVTGGKVSNPTETYVVQLMVNPYILNLVKSIAAIEKTLEKLDDTDKKVIELVYWRRSHTIEGAGMKIGLSRRAAYYRVNNILCLIAVELGLIGL